MARRNFSLNKVICTNDCLESNHNIHNKFDLVKFVCRRAKQLESDQRTPLKHFLTKIRKSRILTGDGHVCNSKNSFALIGRASMLNAFDATNSIEAAMQEIFYGLRSPEIDELIELVNFLNKKNMASSYTSSYSNEEEELTGFEDSTSARFAEDIEL